MEEQETDLESLKDKKIECMTACNGANNRNTNN